MLDSGAIPSVDSAENLARFVLYSKHVRSTDGTIKPDAFIPHPRVEMSVTRHREATEDELWAEGWRVAAIRKLKLYGRADALALVFTTEGLSVVPDPIVPENPNHANVLGWPADKPVQKIRAIEIARKSQYLPAPIGSTMVSDAPSTAEARPKVVGAPLSVLLALAVLIGVPAAWVATKVARSIYIFVSESLQAK